MQFDLIAEIPAGSRNEHQMDRERGCARLRCARSRRGHLQDPETFPNATGRRSSTSIPARRITRAEH